jgi:hypothetical protein
LRMISMHRTAMIYTAMWIWNETVTIKTKLMKRRMMRRKKRRWMRIFRKIRMRRRIRMRMMAKNLGQLARERWYKHQLTM